MPDSVEAEATFEPRLTSASAARRFLRATLRSWRYDRPTETALLLTNELVTNALLHAGTDVTVVLQKKPGRLRVAVGDGSERLPVRRQPSVEATGGRGIPLVDQLSSVWGVDRTNDGKRVWFELRA